MLPARVGSGKSNRSVDLEVALDLPGADVLAKGVPLLLARLEQPLEDVLAQGIQHDVVLLQFGDCLAECGRQRGDVAATQILLGEVIQVLFDRFRQG
jgi:hypothetical protein